MAGRRHVWRIDQQQRVPAPAHFDGVLHGGASRHGVEDAGGWLGAEPGVDRLHDAFQVAAELGVAVVGGLDRDVLPMIAKIEYQHVEFDEQVPPVRIIGIGRKAVAVRDQQPDAIRIAVAAHADLRAVIERNLEALAGCGNFESAWSLAVSLRLWRPAIRRSTLDSRLKSGLCVPQRPNRHLWEAAGRARRSTKKVREGSVSQRLGKPVVARKTRRCCPAAAAMPTTCRSRPARSQPTSSARRIRTPTSFASTPPQRWRWMASGR